MLLFILTMLFILASSLIVLRVLYIKMDDPAILSNSKKITLKEFFKF